MNCYWIKCNFLKFINGCYTSPAHRDGGPCGVDQPAGGRSERDQSEGGRGGGASGARPRLPAQAQQKRPLLLGVCAVLFRQCTTTHALCCCCLNQLTLIEFQFPTQHTQQHKKRRRRKKWLKLNGLIERECETVPNWIELNKS